MKSRRLLPAESRISAAPPSPFLANSVHNDSTSCNEMASLPMQRSAFPRWLKFGGRESKPPDQVVRADAAIDLVLEQIVYQTRLSTCATGAFIGLLRNGQMLYRAMNGATSAEFVAYLRRDPRVVDACLSTSSMPHVHNSDNSSDLDVSVCRSLGARSIVLFPVLNETPEKLGVLGAFSPQADAFAAGDLVKIQSLSHRIADTIARVDELAHDSAGNVPVSAQAGGERRFHTTAEHRTTVGATLASGARRSLVAVLIIGLSLLVGWELTRTVPRGRPHAASRNSTIVVPQSSATAQIPSVPALSVAKPVSPTAIVPVPARTSNRVSGRAKQRVPDLEIENTSDGDSSGIVLFEGTEAKPTSTTSKDPIAGSDSASSTPIIIPERAALDLVVDRVEPEYPNEAKAHHVQGSVVLDLLVGRDGRVERLSRVQGDLGLTASATDAVRQWRFKPVIRNGRPAGFETQITLTFALP